MTTSSPGELLFHEEIATSLAGARAFRVRYRSIDTNGAPTQSTGLVIAPVAQGSDRPIMTWLHGTTGFGDAGSPSAQPDPARDLTLYYDFKDATDIDYGVPHIQSFIDDGWVVCATDYQGQGTPGVHQYTVNRSNALDGLFIVHAATSLDLGMGTALAGAGWSQGGGAVAALAELEPEQYGELNLFAIVAFSPGVPSAALQSGDGAAMANAHVPPDAHAFMLIAGLAAAYPESVTMGDLLTPLGVEIAETTFNTLPVHHLDAVLARAFHHQGPIVREDPQNLAAWQAAIIASSAGQRKPVCPVLICEDVSNPPGQFPCPLPWQEAYAAVIREFGGDVTVRQYDDDHFSLCGSAMPEAKQWLESLRARLQRVGVLAPTPGR